MPKEEIALLEGPFFRPYGDGPVRCSPQKLAVELLSRQPDAVGGPLARTQAVPAAAAATPRNPGKSLARFHRRSRTLVLGDLGWNITPTMPAVVRLWAGRRSGFGPTRPFRLGLRDKEAVRRSTERVLEWNFDRIIPGHGEIVDSDGRAAFRAAYGSL